MRLSFQVGSILGIPIRVHVLLVVLVVTLVASRVVGPIEAGALGLVLVLHELGHCIAARHFGIGVVDITLWPLGGMARMTHMPESSRVEGWVAVAGPAVNLALALVALPVFLASEPRSSLHHAALFFLLVNASLGLFNLIPAFPTDGGRILRAILARDGDWVKATERAVIVGRVFAVLVGIAGWQYGNWMAPILALWLVWMGFIEVANVRERHARAVPEDEVAPLQQEFSEPRTASRRSRYSDEDIERLERFRGRLRPFDGGP